MCRTNRARCTRRSFPRCAPDIIVLDFNHPLAGETLHFQVKVIDLRPATAEELDHGHIHGDGHEHHE